MIDVYTLHHCGRLGSECVWKGENVITMFIKHTNNLSCCRDQTTISLLTAFYTYPYGAICQSPNIGSDNGSKPVHWTSTLLLDMIHSIFSIAILRSYCISYWSITSKSVVNYSHLLSYGTQKKIVITLQIGFDLVGGQCVYYCWRVSNGRQGEYCLWILPTITALGVAVCLENGDTREWGKSAYLPW